MMTEDDEGDSDASEIMTHTFQMMEIKMELTKLLQKPLYISNYNLRTHNHGSGCVFDHLPSIDLAKWCHIFISYIIYDGIDRRSSSWLSQEWSKCHG